MTVTVWLNDTSIDHDATIVWQMTKLVERKVWQTIFRF